MVQEEELVTIKIKRRTRNRLKTIHVKYGDTVDDVVNMLIGCYERHEETS